MPAADFFGFLTRSLSLLATEQPKLYQALCAAMAGLRARLDADGVARCIRFDFPHWTIYTGEYDADLDVAFDRQIILDLMDGRLTMEQAITQERLRMRGPVDTVERFYVALLIYLEGLLRTSGAAAILEDYR